MNFFFPIRTSFCGVHRGFTKLRRRILTWLTSSPMAAIWAEMMMPTPSAGTTSDLGRRFFFPRFSSTTQASSRNPGLIVRPRINRPRTKMKTVRSLFLIPPLNSLASNQFSHPESKQKKKRLGLDYIPKIKYADFKPVH